MNFQQLRIIRETVRQNFNLTEAANVLLTSQSGVSKHIRDLEDELGFEIFVRRGKRLLGLTDPGREVAAVVERILLETQNLEDLSSSIAKRDSGALIVATTHTQARYSLPAVIADFKKAFPAVRLTLKQLSPKDIASVILEGRADVGIATDTLEHNPDILTFPFFIMGTRHRRTERHPLARHKRVSLDAVAAYPIITYDEGLRAAHVSISPFRSRGLFPMSLCRRSMPTSSRLTSNSAWALALSRRWPSTLRATPGYGFSRLRVSSKRTHQASRCAAAAFCAAMSIASSK